jgi:type II secretory pathway pseudopilin PulG
MISVLFHYHWHESSEPISSSKGAHFSRFSSRRRVNSAGFTLIEVLITLALTMIMLVLFATIFQQAASFVTRNKAIAENDQSARTLATVLKSDLQARTMFYLAPFQVNAPYTPVTIDAQRVGYFYISENNPLDDTDDVLQFTVQLTTPDSPFYGRAAFLPTQQWQATTAFGAPPSAAPWMAYVAPVTKNGFIYFAQTAGTSGATEPAWPTTVGATVADGTVTWQCVDSTLQPDGDDGIAHYLNSPAVGLSVMDPNSNYSVNNTGASQYAEVSYFLRHGNLIRRVLLIRQPNNTMGSGSTQPGLSSSPINNGPYPGNFWSDFDYSGRYDNVNPNSLGPRFFGVSDLSNTTLPPSGYALGQPFNRFGHDQTDGTAAQNGLPREYDSNGNFIGRFTNEETSYSPSSVASTLWFGFPGYIPTAGSPMARSTNVTLDSTGTYVTQFQGGSHRGEDILLTNVVSFDIKVLDPLYSESTADLNRNGIIDAGPAPAFADIGHTAPTGVFCQAAANFATTQQPSPTGSGNGTAAVSGYGPHPAVAGDTVPNNVFDTWHPQYHFQVNTTATYDQPPYTGQPNAGDGVTNPASPFWAAGVAYTAGQLVAPQPVTSATAPAPLIVNGLVYQCIVGGTSGTTQPFLNGDTPTSTGANAIVDGTARWIAVPPIQAIQITVKYLDPTQNLLRQVTIVQQVTQ